MKDSKPSTGCCGGDMPVIATMSLTDISLCPYKFVTIV